MIKFASARSVLLASGLGIALTGCVTTPMGPMIPASPGPNKSFTAFQQDENACEQYAADRVKGGVDRANNRAVGTAAITTLLGAGLGAAVGNGRGAAIGAASGAVVGSAAGANESAYAEGSIQRRYDIAYGECMSSKGNDVGGPMRKRHRPRYMQDGYGAPPPDSYGPPPGTPPPPDSYGPPDGPPPPR